MGAAFDSKRAGDGGREGLVCIPEYMHRARSLGETVSKVPCKTLIYNDSKDQKKTILIWTSFDSERFWQGLHE